ncbi:hypothetical protein OPIT5_12960 [Opitutaceae bacterium TAV5]|nr:hypothetical protein OPIT5_12960 [Opitutaceae bacterium TAV5]
MKLNPFFALAALLILAPLAARATPVELRFPSEQRLIFTGAGPQSIQIEVETGLVLPGLSVTLELRRYDVDGRLPPRAAKPVSTAESTDDIRGGGGPVYLQLSIPATGFYELTATATNAEGATIARTRTVLAALARTGD